jgi:hypothetical protein
MLAVLKLVLQPILGFIVKPVTDYVAARSSDKSAVVQATNTRKATEQENIATWEHNVMTQSVVWLRILCALHIFVALDATVYLALRQIPNPERIFTALNKVPDWFAGLTMCMFAFAFAAAPLKAAGASLAATWRSRRSNTPVSIPGLPDK